MTPADDVSDWSDKFDLKQTAECTAVRSSVHLYSVYIQLTYQQSAAVAALENVLKQRLPTSWSGSRLLSESVYPALSSKHQGI